MRLNKLEIKGFKSFGDKITINFNEGITAIVGPNGCGKSNVVDAIRWVLGEQSTRMLRSEKMENIIFNGTKSRKPANLAEVSLSFDNTKNILPTEFSSVTITRKLYRTGESEYRLNDVKCRLKDITDLFLDTGIGADTYSIIELRMIDEIINNKDNSRRNLFEEASGISKYKVRKRQTLVKLNDTETDLARIEDLLYEINKNLKTLENQAKKAEKYILLRNSYKQQSILLAKHKLIDFQNQLEAIAAKDQLQQDHITTIQSKIAQDEAALQQLKLELLTKEKNLSIQQKATNQHFDRIRTYESEKKIKNQQMQHLQEHVTKLQDEIKSDTQQHQHIQYNQKRLSEDLFIEQEKLKDITHHFTLLTTLLEELRSQQHSAKTKVDLVSNQIKALQQQIDVTDKELTILEIQKQTLQQESERTINDAQDRESELSLFCNQIDELTDQIANLSELQQSISRQETALNDQRIVLENNLVIAKEELIKQTRTLDAKKNEYSLTKSLVDNLEGFPESIRFLKKNAGWKTNFPLFSDILFCEEKYRIAIENFIEPIMNHYVVDSFQDAKQAIELLKNTSRGRAHFFVLETLSQLPTVISPDETLIPILDVVSFELKYKPLIHNLLNHVFISENNDITAIQHPKEATILQQNGNFTITSMGMSGGSIGLFEGKRIGRAKNLELLAKEIQKLTSQIDKTNNAIEEITIEIETLKSASRKVELEELQLQMHRLNSEFITIKTKQEQHLSFMKESSLRKETIEQKLLQIDRAILQNIPQIKIHKEALLSLQTESNNINENFNSLSEQLLDQGNNYNKQNILIHQQQNKVSSILKDLEYREAQQESIETRLNKNQKDLLEVEKLMQEALQFVDHNDVELLALYSQKETLADGLRDLEEKYHEEKKISLDLESIISATRHEKDSLLVIVESLREDRTNLKIELNALKERLTAEFSIDINDLLEDLTDDLPNNIEEVKINIDQLKRKLGEYGNINPMAKEAYDEILERHNFIEKEMNDLIHAKSSLLNTIKEIDDTANGKFMESFSAVRANFIEVFRSLFNEEDNCDLILSNPQNPLESDIDIVARPKGKRPLSINQLSGGEKTLTATALLFSLYLLKPAPFCIFDEVDAPLDDTNIDKFNNIIRKFSDQSQFIVVSHNKKTIASTDIIYGVTMVEEGISRVVSVDLMDVA